MKASQDHELFIHCFQNVVFVLFCCFFCCACQYFADIQFKKHTLELNYYLQVNVSLPSAIFVATTFNSMRYIICPKHSFHVTQPSLLSIEPDFPFTWPHSTCTENQGMDTWSKYKLHLIPKH